MIKELFFLCAPCQFKPGVLIYPPKVKDVVCCEDYEIYSRLLTYSQEEVEDEFLEAKQPLEIYPTPLEFLLNNAYHNERYRQKCLEAFKFFLHEDVTFLYEQKVIIVGEIKDVLKKSKSLEDIIMITEEDFFGFQNMIRESIGKKIVEPPIVDEDPRIAEIKRKARYRDKLKAKKAAKGQGGISFYTMLVSICCMGLGVTPLNIGEMSYIALMDIVRKYQEKEKYDTDIASLLAGADSKKIKPKYWIRNFED